MPSSIPDSSQLRLHRVVDYQALLVDHLELIDRIVSYTARKHHLSALDAEEFSSIVRFRLIDRDFAILRKFEQRSNLATYLTTVIERVYLDFCITRWGKWRPSAAARRLGPVAVRLEQLLTRDGLSFAEAVGTLQTNHGVTQSRDELQALMVQLPVRAVRRAAGEEELAIVASRGGAVDAAFDRFEDEDLIKRVEAALARAVGTLPPADQLILRMRYQDGLPVAQIARILSLDAKPIYRRLEQVAGLVRDAFDRAGLDPADVGRIVGHPALTLGRVLETPDSPVSQRPLENGEMGPSKA